LPPQRGKKDPLLPADYFDLIIGTSTGGILALMLGRLRMPIRVCMDKYRTLSVKVFGAGMISNAITLSKSVLFAGGISYHDSAKLEKHVKSTVAECEGGDPEAVIVELKPGACKTAVVTAQACDGARAIVLRSYSVSGIPDEREPFKIWEAARATTAAPLFFKPVEVGHLGIKYIDGAVSGNCNPTRLAMEEVEKLWPDRDIGLVLSLGTGSPSTISLQGPVYQLALAFVNLSSNTFQVHEAAQKHFNKTYSPSPYIRFSVEQHLEKVLLNDYEAVVGETKIIASVTKSYLAMEQQIQQMQRCVDLGTGLLRAEQRPSLVERSSSMFAKLKINEALLAADSAISGPAPPYKPS